MTEPIRRTTFKSLAKPLRVGGVTRTSAIISITSGAAVDRVLVIGMEPLYAAVLGLGVGVGIYMLCKLLLKHDPAIFAILRESIRQKARYDAAKRQPVEVRVT